MMSQAEALVKEGRRAADLSITDDLAKAVDMYARLKQQGADIDLWLGQMSLVEEELNPLQKELLGYIHANVRSRKKLRELLALYADNVVNTQTDPNQMALFGGAAAGKGEILDAAAEQVTGKDAGFAAATAPAAENPELIAQPVAQQVNPAAISAQTAINDAMRAGAVPAETPVGAGQPPAVPPQAPVAAPPQAQPEPQRVSAMGAPLGTADQYSEPPVEEAMLEGWMKQVLPALDRAESALLDTKNRKTGIAGLDVTSPGEVQAIDEPTRKRMTKYLGQINADMADAKLAAIRYGEQKRDFALLNYQARTGADNLLGTVMPYEFWYTRSMLNWALRSIARPTTLLNWARLRALQEKYMEGEGSIPTRLKKKIKIQMPFLPDWMGGGAYVDPMKQLFPIEQLTRPWETLGEEKTLELRKAESALAQMVESEDITESQMQQALASRNGPIWERAIAQARNEADSQIKNPLDFAFMMSGPSLPISMAYSYMTGRQNEIGQLPITRLIQANTAALGLGGPTGVNIEAGLRKAGGLPEVDQYQDYRVDRMLSNLTAEGKVTADDARRAMIDRSGPAFDLAQQRVTQMGLWQYWGAPLGVDMFPEGEKGQRALQTVYNQARDKWANGDKNALTAFYDAHPEYEARRDSFRDPESRLRNYLISDVWDRYMQLPEPDKERNPRPVKEHLPGCLCQQGHPQL